MSLTSLSRFFSLCLAVAAAPALADESGIKITNGTVQLNCPEGTLQNTTKISKDTAVFCKKTSKTEGNEPVRHGPYVAFWPNGQKSAAGQTKDGFQVGRWTFWDANGAKTGETEFLRDNYHGKRIEFYSNGSRKLEQQWLNGKQEGLSVAYAEDGQKVAEMHFKEGHLVKEQRFENGRPVVSK